VHLEVTPVEPIVVDDNELRKLDVAVLERLHHAIELLDDEVKAAERGALQPLELLVEMLPCHAHPA
jgi:hypothetical protein